MIHISEDNSHVWLEVAIQAPKIGVLGDFGPLNVIIHHHRDPQKAHPYVNRLAINCKNPLRGLTCRRDDRKCDGQTHTHTHTQVNLYSVHV